MVNNKIIIYKLFKWIKEKAADPEIGSSRSSSGKYIRKGLDKYKMSGGNVV